MKKRIFLMMLPLAMMQASCAVPVDEADEADEAEDVGEVGQAVYGGTEWPAIGHKWLARLSVPGNDVWCGGTILKPEWVLTAARCVDSFVSTPSSLTVTLGDHNRTINEGTEVIRQAAQIVVHPNWNPSTESSDIALIKLDAPVDAVGMVLHSTLEPYHLSLTWSIYGWGETFVGSGPSAVVRTETVHRHSTPLLSNDVCAQALGRPLDETMLCAGIPPYGGGCTGDEGGPLMRWGGKAAHRVMGIISWGAPNCDSYSVFTNTEYFDGWVNSIVGGGV